MTPRELAEKIATIVWEATDHPMRVEMIESLLSSALEEARMDEFHVSSKAAVDMNKAIEQAKAAAYQEGFLQGKKEVNDVAYFDWTCKLRQEAYESCAKMAEAYKYSDQCSGYEILDVAKQIRQAAKELK